MYIAIEGIDGSGKTTLLKNILIWLERNQLQYSINCPTQPCKNKFFEFLTERYSFLRSNRIFRAFLYGVRHLHAARLTNWDSPLIIGDRSILTSYVTYWKYYSKNSLIFKFYIHYLEKHSNFPDYVIFLSVSLTEIVERLNKRGQELTIDENLPRLIEMRNAFESLKFKNIIKFSKINWIEIDASASEVSVTNKTVQILNDIFIQYKMSNKFE